MKLAERKRKERGKRQAAAPVTRPSLAHMSTDETLSWIRATRAALARKMQRERAYLDRRAARGVATPTDEAYEQDQILEADLLTLLDEMEQTVLEVQA
ncbi:MAG TPA: hypothetical protein VKV40_08070 [Ktedonobacteraceae bacterium]|nr:hypothetical protein [Ktedonobacteraceae bacterium]